MNDLILLDEWYIDSIYSFMDGQDCIIPMDERVKYFAKHYDENPKKIQKDVDDKLGDVFPYECDEDDIRNTISEWLKDNPLPDNEGIYIEYVDDGNMGQIRVMHFRVS